ncbi:radical SAM protein [Treponema pedis]|uniref:radical SAM protein n=1 Tax=Treponema pedis TaxID=409322 RepID=UPI0004189579|nr:radical SAM protein [Treponema pedis]
MEIIYNPSLRFKNEGSRCIAYSIDDFFHNVENLTVLSPQEVIKLLLFDGSADFSTIAERIAYVFSFPITDKLDIVKKIKADIKSIETRMNFSPLLVPVSNFSEKIIEKTKQRYKIADFFINKKDINLQRYNLRVSAPLSVNFNVSTSCRFNCKYCYHPLYGLKDYISLDRLTQLFKEFKDNGCESVLLAGGDPMLRSDILDIMIALYKTGLFYTISTKSILSIDK